MEELQLETKKLNKMKTMRKSEVFECEYPYGEPDQKEFAANPYQIERLEKKDGEVVWFGCETNWIKTPEGQWTKIDGVNLVDCEMPIYEELYIKLNINESTS